MTDFLEKEYLKISLTITSTNNDSKLDEIVKDANNEIDKILTPYADVTPIIQNTNLFKQGKFLATIYASSRWYRDTGQIDRAKESSEEYDRKKESVIDTLKANRTSRTKTTFIPGDDPLEQTYQPFNVDEYITRVF